MRIPEYVIKISVYLGFALCYEIGYRIISPLMINNCLYFATEYKPTNKYQGVTTLKVTPLCLFPLDRLEERFEVTLSK